ncbi:radical SAM protein [Candidatus Woesearchaeota archaeon]|nr:radical SAM protein [Candidatus Woesearchaeota archaeon]
MDESNMKEMLLQIKNFRQKAKIAKGIYDRKVYAGPWEVQIDITNMCNYNCIGCWCHSPLLGDLAMDAETKKKKLPFPLIKKILKELKEMGTRYIYFTGGGEPFMHPKAIEIIEYAKKQGFMTDMSTNFSLVTKETAERLVKAGMDHMNVSLWAGSPESYAATHPNRKAEDFNKITDMLSHISSLKKRYKKKRPVIHLYNVISTKNYQDFDNMVETAFRTGVNGIDFTPTDVIPGRTDSLMLNRDQANWLANKVEKADALLERLEEKYARKIEFRSRPQFSRRLRNMGIEHGEYDTAVIGKQPCYAGWTFLRILANGNVNSCLKSVRIPIGNIYDDQIKEIWMNKKQQEFRKHTLDYDPKNPYFENMGNEHQKGNGCMLLCDNLGLNLAVHKRLSRFSKAEKKIINIIGKL